MRRRPVKNVRRDKRNFAYTASRTNSYNVPRRRVTRGGFRF